MPCSAAGDETGSGLVERLEHCFGVGGTVIGRRSEEVAEEVRKRGRQVRPEPMELAINATRTRAAANIEQHGPEREEIGARVE